MRWIFWGVFFLLLSVGVILVADMTLGLLDSSRWMGWTFSVLGAFCIVYSALYGLGVIKVPKDERYSWKLNLTVSVVLTLIGMGYLLEGQFFSRFGFYILLAAFGSFIYFGFGDAKKTVDSETVSPDAGQTRSK